LLGNEPFRRRDRMNTEIIVPAAGNAHEALRRLHFAVHHGAMTLPARKSERNWSFNNRRTGTNQECCAPTSTAEVKEGSNTTQPTEFSAASVLAARIQRFV
jgi:hypothetical protein